jgi:hypothetical protein
MILGQIELKHLSLASLLIGKGLLGTNTQAYWDTISDEK